MLRILFLSLFLISSFAFAGNSCHTYCNGGSDYCSNSCGSGKGSWEDHCHRPDWGYSYNSAYYAPDWMPCPMKCFHDKLIPMMEARKSGESAYIHEHAGQLYYIAKEIPGSLKCGNSFDRKMFNSAAKDLARDCKRLKELAYGGTSSTLYSKMHEVEQDFIRLCNLTDD